MLMLLTEDGTRIDLNVPEPCILKIDVRRLGQQLRLLVDVEEPLSEDEEERTLGWGEMVSIPIRRD